MANPFIKNIDLLNVSQLLYQSDRSFATKMDEEDPLAKYRDQFHIPKNERGEEKTYLCGNSLGLQSTGAADAVHQVMDQWRELGVKGHFNGEEPWVQLHWTLKEKMAEVVGAFPSEVTLMNTLTVNLHLMMASFYKPEGKRTKILMEEDAFPSDRYAIESQIEWHGLDPEKEIVLISKDPGKTTITESSIENILKERGDEIALVLVGGVNYYTGQVFDLAKISKWSKASGCRVGFDLAHAVGNIPLSLHDIEADFAVWCTYKYLNGGPGSIAGAFVHVKHHNDLNLPKLKGWWGHDPEIRFKMRDGFQPAPGIESWQISCQPILSLAPIKASLALFSEIGMKALRNKSVLLTGYLEYLLNELGNKKIKILTPELQSQRGCQLSIFIEGGDQSIYEELTKNDIVVDWRNPGVIRVAPAPIYNSYSDVWRFVEVLKKVI